MNALELLAQQTTERFPGIEARFDPPENLQGSHWLDLKHGDKKPLTIEWVPSKGFGFFAPDASYGERPELVIADPLLALGEVVRRLEDLQ